jgi:hypothetical protein
MIPITLITDFVLDAAGLRSAGAGREVAEELLPVRRFGVELDDGDGHVVERPGIADPPQVL